MHCEGDGLGWKMEVIKCVLAVYMIQEFQK